MMLPDEDMDTEADQITSDVNMLGKIDVEFSRGKRRQTISSKAVVKDNHISHAIR